MTPDARVARIASRQFGIVTTAQARSCGLTNDQVLGRVAAGRWERVHRGVYRLAGVPPSRQQDVFAACLAGGRGAVVSHEAAVELWGSGSRAGSIEISVPRGRRVRRPGIVVHQARLSKSDVTRLGVIPITTPARTLIDVAARYTDEVLEEMLDQSLRTDRVTLRRLEQRFADGVRKGSPGAKRMRRLLGSRRPGEAISKSLFEKWVFNVIRKDGLPLPVKQYVIRREDGRFVAEADLCYPDIRLVIELDSRRYHSGMAKTKKDQRRENALEVLGWHVLRFTYAMYRESPGEIPRSLRDALTRRGAA